MLANESYDARYSSPACAHRFVGLDAVDAIAVFQKQLAQETRAGADVGDHMAGRGDRTRCAAVSAPRSGSPGDSARSRPRGSRIVLFGVGEGHGNCRKKRTSF